MPNLQKCQEDYRELHGLGSHHKTTMVQPRTTPNSAEEAGISRCTNNNDRIALRGVLERIVSATAVRGRPNTATKQPRALPIVSE